MNELLLRLDEVLANMGVSSGLPGMEAAPMPKFDSSKYTAEELVVSEVEATGPTAT